MSNVDDNDDADTGDTGTENNAAKTLRKQNAQLAKDLAEAQTQIAKFAAAKRAGSIADFLDANKAPKKLAKYVERDLEGDITEEAVRKWLEDEGELFGWQPDSDDSEDEDDNVRDARRISRSTNDAPAAQAGWTAEKIRSASHKELIAAGILTA